VTIEQRDLFGVPAHQRAAKWDALFSSKTCMHATPQSVFDALHAEFKFELDVCASPENAKCARFFTVADDGLTKAWVGVCWMNPPYGREIARWVRKARVSSDEGATVVCLLPVRTGTSWWQAEIIGPDPENPRAKVRYLPGRLRFGGAKTGAPFDSAVVIFRPRNSVPGAP
jgi:phage N-6-adenine-methyltransferase